MKAVNRPKLYVSLAFLLMTFLTIHAQPPGYQAAVNKTYNNMQMQQSLNNTMRQVRTHAYGIEYLKNNNYNFMVLLMDSTELTVRSRIHSDTTVRINYLIYENKYLPKNDSNRKQRIVPTQTISIKRLDRNTNSFVQGIATDSCWLFKVVSGKINIFSFLSETDITTDYISAIQLGDGPIEPLREERLREMLQGNEKTLKALEKIDYYKAIRRFNSK